MICSLMYNFDTDNWSFVGGTSNNKNINCSGTETRLIDCPVLTLSNTATCTYLLLKCSGYTLPTGRPTPIPTVSLTPVTTDSGPLQTPVTSDSGTSLTTVTSDSGPSLTPVTTDSGTSLTPVTAGSGTSQTSSQSTVPEVVSSPDITAPQSTSEDGPPLAALATATSLALVVILLLLALSSIIILRKRMLNREKSQRYKYIANHVAFTCDQLLLHSATEGEESQGGSGNVYLRKCGICHFKHFSQTFCCCCTQCSL